MGVRRCDVLATALQGPQAPEPLYALNPKPLNVLNLKPLLP